MGSGAGKGGAHSAFSDHEVGVAEGCDGNFYEDLVRGEGGGGGDGVDFVGGVELVVRSAGGLGTSRHGRSTSTTCAASMVSGMPSMPMMSRRLCRAKTGEVRFDLASVRCLSLVFQRRERPES